jgi:hypothetical protein
LAYSPEKFYKRKSQEKHFARRWKVRAATRSFSGEIEAIFIAAERLSGSALGHLAR